MPITDRVPLENQQRLGKFKLTSFPGVIAASTLDFFDRRVPAREGFLVDLTHVVWTPLSIAFEYQTRGEIKVDDQLVRAFADYLGINQVELQSHRSSFIVEIWPEADPLEARTLFNTLCRIHPDLRRSNIATTPLGLNIDTVAPEMIRFLPGTLPNILITGDRGCGKSSLMRSMLYFLKRLNRAQGLYLSGGSEHAPAIFNHIRQRLPRPCGGLAQPSLKVPFVAFLDDLDVLLDRADVGTAYRDLIERATWDCDKRNFYFVASVNEAGIWPGRFDFRVVGRLADPDDAFTATTLMHSPAETFEPGRFMVFGGRCPPEAAIVIDAPYTDWTPEDDHE